MPTASSAISTRADEEPINLLRGWPHASLLPTQHLLAASTAVLTNPTISTPALLYGDDEGWEPLRIAIAAWLTKFYRPNPDLAPVTAERISITGGASPNLGNILSVYTDPSFTRAVWCVAPTYFLAFRVFEDAGFGGRMHAVPEDAGQGGVDIAFLRREMNRCEEEWSRGGGSERAVYKGGRGRDWAKVYKHVVYCVPTFSNPSSRTMSLECRRGMVRVAREFDALVVCDDVYDFLLWDAEGSTATGMERAHLPRIVDVDRDLDGGAEREGTDGFGNVCANGTFSKIAGPGVRVGWVEGTDKFAYGASQAGTTCSGGAPSQLTSTFIHHLLTNSALDTHIRQTLVPALHHRSNILLAAISIHLLPLGFTVLQQEQTPGLATVKGGYFAWLHLPTHLHADANVLARRCLAEENVVIAAGELFEVPGDGRKVEFGRCVRLCWAWEDEGRLGEGVRRFAGVVERMLKEQKEGKDGELENGEGIGVRGFK